MDHQVTSDPILARLRSALAGAYGDRLERVVLFGSRARGDFRPESDYDVAVFIRDWSSRWDELGRLAEISTDILVETGAMIAAIPFHAGAYTEPTPLMQAISRDGHDL